nr:BatA domain-containing protein [Pseudopedobacter sp.]
MGFLFPEFLFAWLLIAIPVIIHLFNFRKFKKVYFTNVAFLKEVELQTSSVQKLKERLILASRMLAIFFLVLAFAQPYLKSKTSAQAFKKSVVSIYLDNSYSMEAVNKNGTLLDEGKRKVKEIVDAYSLNDRFQLITNDFEGKQQRLLDKTELLDELENVKISPLTRDYQTLVNRQQEVLLKEQGVKRVAYLLSDFQKQSDLKNTLKVDTSIQLNAVQLIANELPNISIDTVYFLSPIHQPQANESLVYKVSNHSDKQVKQIPIQLKINGAQKALANLDIDAQKVVLDTLAFSGLNAGWQEANIQLKDYPITFDDQLQFIFEVKSTLPILGVYQNSPFKNFSAAYQTDPFFNFQEVNESQINYSGLDSKQLIVLENLKTISEGLAQQLKQYVENGGNLSVFIPANADLNSYQKTFQSFGIDDPIALKKQDIKATTLNIQHPFFKNIFDRLPKNPDLPAASFYFESSKLTRTTKQVLMNGEGNSPLLSLYPTKKGNIFISWMPLENELSNFSRHALFLPILFKMAFTGSQEKSLFYTLGQNNSIDLKGLNLPENEIIKIKNKQSEIIPEWRQSPGGAVLYFADQIKSAGFYDVVYQNKIIDKIAFNESRKESDRQFYSDKEIETALGINQKNIFNGAAAPLNQQIKESDLGSTLWKVCLILAIMFLIAEILLIRFFKNSISKPLNA